MSCGESESNINEKNNNNNDDDDESILDAKKRKLDKDNQSKTSSELNEGNNNEEEAELEQVELDEINVEGLVNEDVYGIVERVNKSFQRFTGIIKQSPSDFIVNEIDLKGNVVRLNNFDIPVVEKPVNENEKDQDQMTDEIKKIIGQGKYDSLKNYLETNTSYTESFKIEAPKDKSDRKSVHDFIKLFYKKYNSNTIQESNIQFIEISNNRSKRPHDSYRNNRDKSNEIGNFKFCECSMYKENIDTIKAVSLIARNLRINTKRIGYSGTKDKKAKTTQLVSFFRMEPKQLLRLNNTFHNIKLGNFILRDGEGLKLGDLSGNRFKIVIREVSEKNEEIIKSCVDSLKNNGFVNYFGLQRFGTCPQAPTHLIGKHLILNNIKEAIELILKPRDGTFEKKEVKMAREIWNLSEHDADKALSYIEKINCVEKFVLTGLSECSKNDYLGAFQYLPRNMRLMYLHSYQSYIWNMATTKRIDLYGFKPVVGDLVREKTQSQNTNEKDNVIVLDETRLNEFNIEDVILPLPGFNVLYPNNQIKDYYEELLLKDGIKIDGLKNKIKDFSLGGDYRNIIVKPNDLAYEIIDYSEKSKQLAKGDWELMENEPLKNDQNIESQQTETSSDVMYKAIVLEYNLPSSSYATMALREFLN